MDRALVLRRGAGTLTEREFTDDEVAEILARASDRQAAAERRRLPQDSRVSLAALEAVARDVGIDVAHVRAAAVEVASRSGPGAPEAEVKFGVPSRVGTERLVPGGVSVEAWGRMVGVLRDHFGVQGLLSEFGETREWVSTNAAGPGQRQVRLRVERASEGTRMVVEEATAPLRTAPLVLGTTFGSMAAVLAVLNVVFGTEPGAVVFMAVLAVVAAILGVGGLKLASHMAVARGEDLEGIADRLELIARTGDEETT